MRALSSITVMILVFQSSVLMAAGSVWTISAEEWARPRSGYGLSQMKSLQDSINGMNDNAGSKLIIKYPGGEEGLLWVSELKDWLVSLGVPSRKIKMRAGQPSHEIITLMLD
ncbi:MAG: hypothetical protein GXP13_09350 [Gammaproteobacteria bacterium]|nr:hypothetical protein [Gammaproteobacteria bacterium]